MKYFNEVEGKYQDRLGNPPEQLVKFVMSSYEPFHTDIVPEDLQQIMYEQLDEALELTESNLETKLIAYNHLELRMNMKK